MGTLLVRVLLVDDDPSSIRRIRRMLHAERDPPFQLDRARTLSQAKAQLASDRTDVILLNLQATAVGGLPGLAVLRAIAPGLPILVMAPAAAESLALKAVQHGARDYLISEQVYPLLLVRTIRHTMERQRVEEERRTAEYALRASERRYRALFEHSRDAIFITDASGRIIEANAAALELLRYPGQEMKGLMLRSLCGDDADGNLLEEELTSESPARELEVRLRRSDGEVRWCMVSAAARVTDAGEVAGYQAVVHDITARKQAEERLLHNAFHDTLTGLPNRALFADRLEVALARWRRRPADRCAVLFLDLDRFKVVNDSLGHAAGDALLVAIARALSSCMRSEDTVARLGGDEFAILIDEVRDESDAVQAAERVLGRLEQPFELFDQRLFTGVSIGIALPDSPDQQPADLLRNADIAMYRAKAGGRGRYAIFAPSMHAVAINLLELETDLRNALQRREFVLHYQPIVALPDQRVVGFEALIRWRHPTRGLLAPGDFVHLAEETGIIVPIGWWTLREACREAKAMLDPRRPDEAPYMAVNLSGRQIALPGLVDEVAATLAATGLPGELLSLEITESSLMANPVGAAASLSALRALGVMICIDDFGTGYSSLGYLQTFPADGLKIDRSFIDRLGSSPDRAELVRTIIALANRLGMVTVAEGVETAEQLRQLEDLAPSRVQGFLFSEAVDAETARRMIDPAAGRAPQARMPVVLRGRGRRVAP
jgi:diguanylate cyclase (GGDEF)-like protein/PAS domain S-box-containing protein